MEDLKYYYVKFDLKMWRVEQTHPRGSVAQFTKSQMLEFATGSIEQIILPSHPGVGKLILGLIANGHVKHLLTLHSSLISGPNAKTCTYWVKRKVVVPSNVNLETGTSTLKGIKKFSMGESRFICKLNMEVTAKLILEDDALILAENDESLLVGLFDELSTVENSEAKNQVTKPASTSQTSGTPNVVKTEQRSST